MTNSPSGLNLATDEALTALLADIEDWREKLPESLRFRGPDTPRQPGLLFLLYSCICMIFWRVFMRISYTCPAHLKFQLTIEKWSDLVKLTGDSIEWLDHHDSLYDVWMFVAYAATSCALVQVSFVQKFFLSPLAKIDIVSYLGSSTRSRSCCKTQNSPRLHSPVGEVPLA